MGEELALSGKLVRVNDGWGVLLDDGQTLRLPFPPGHPENQPITLVITSPERHRQNREELARNLLTEILNGA